MCSSSIACAYSLLRALVTPRASTRRLLRSSLHPVRRYSLSHRLCSSHTIAAPCTYYPHSVHLIVRRPHPSCTVLRTPHGPVNPRASTPRLRAISTPHARLHPRTSSSAPHTPFPLLTLTKYPCVRSSYAPSTPHTRSPPLMRPSCTTALYAPSPLLTLARCLCPRAPLYVPTRYLRPLRVVSALRAPLLRIRTLRNSFTLATPCTPLHSIYLDEHTCISTS
jgi:hypothetical protein